ncbi:methyltransferase domain-containing protein [bacterium]|nr:methyltransferase domain-containing protein [bacterium]NBW98425.1 methyltransferase domain-containing protein [bacterium]NBX82184.1 methyltransferase domain-containing protein [bacterium]
MSSVQQSLELPPLQGKEYYDENYRHYQLQNPAKKFSFYRKLIAQYSNAELPLSIHDIGCAFGLFLQSLTAEWKKFGSDINAYAIREAQRNDPNSYYLVNEALSTPTLSEKVAVITAFDVLEHVGNLKKAAHLVHEQLLPGGTFLFVVPVYDGLSGPIISCLDKDPTHIHKRERAFWLDWAQKHFEVVHWQGLIRYLFFSKFYLHLPVYGFLKWHAPAIAIVCKKKAL